MSKLQVDGYYIAVLDKGFVYVGEVTQYDNGYLIEEARNIRVWGTKDGLGQLARSGPTKDTVLDAAGSLLVPSHAAQHFIVTEKAKWTKGK